MLVWAPHSPMKNRREKTGRLQRKLATGKRTSQRMTPVPSHQHSSANSTAAGMLVENSIILDCRWGGTCQAQRLYQTGSQRTVAGKACVLTGTRKRRPKVSAACAA